MLLILRTFSSLRPRTAKSTYAIDEGSFSQSFGRLSLMYALFGASEEADLMAKLPRNPATGRDRVPSARYGSLAHVGAQHSSSVPSCGNLLPGACRDGTRCASGCCDHTWLNETAEKISQGATDADRLMKI